MIRLRVFLPILLLGVLIACGGGIDLDEEAAESAPDTENAAAANAAGAGEARIPFAPTPEDSLPSAIVGQAPAPGGTDVVYFPEDSAATGYLALPAAEGTRQGVLLIHEWDGLNDRIRQVADALAAEGYAALAVDLYSGRTGSNPEENRELVQETMANQQTVIANLDAAARYLRDRSGVGERLATMGWCFGGGVALSYAIGGENHEGTAVFYGRLLQDPDSLATIDHEVYGTFAAEDQGIPPEQVDSFVAALRSAGVPNDVHVYDDVNHGFWLWVEDDPQTRRAPALDAWQRLKAYLGRVLAEES